MAIRTSTYTVVSLLAFGLAACSDPAPTATETAQTPEEAPAPPAAMTEQELPSYDIPNIPDAAEAYFSPDSKYLIAQTKDPDAVKNPSGSDGSLTYILAVDGSEYWRVNDRGQDACSFFFPDMTKVVWTSTRDHMDMPIGNWSDQDEYPQGAELYVSGLHGENIQRLTNNEYYEAEVTLSPNGEWIVFGRQIDGRMDLWIMKSDGTEERRLTDTADWQEGAPLFLPDNEHIMFRAWRRSEYGKISPTPMTVFTIRKDGTGWRRHTFTHDLNWAPFPAPDGRHYVFVRVGEGRNWDIFLGDLAGGEPRRLTYQPSFDGYPALSPDGTKMAWGRVVVDGETRRQRTFIMDVSSLGIGPGNYVPFDENWGEAMEDDPPASP